jgi:hypothetical protein
VLLKSSDDKSKRLKLLEELQKSERLDDRQRKWLRDQFWRLRPGIKGEKDAAYYLDHVFKDSPENALLHDLRLIEGDRTAQIDHLIVTRALNFYLLETKTFGGDLHINEHGEFSVEYSGERIFGIESPLEQSKRHELVLRKVLERLGIAGRMGSEPTFIHVVLVHPKARIHRPPAGTFDASTVIKADQFFTWRENFIEKSLTTTKVLGVMLNMRGRETVREWAEMLRREHRPENPFDLPDFMKPQPVAAAKATRGKSAVLPTQALMQQDAKTIPGLPAPAAVEAAKSLCTECGRTLSENAAAYCRANTKLFGDKLYCFAHQQPFKTKPSNRTKPPAAKFP